MNSLFFLGIGGWHHDAAAAIVRDGRIVAAAEEERFTRVKHQRGVPRRAIEYCLKKAGVKMEDLGGAGVFFVPADAVFAALRLATRRLVRGGPFGIAHSGYDVCRGWRLFCEMQEALLHCPKVRFFGHHLTHAAAALRLSTFERTAVLSVDELGEIQSTWWGRGDRGTLEPMGAVDYPHSLGKLYSAVSQHLGFEELEEFRVMGLAAYGTPALVERFRRLVRLTPDGFDLDLDFFNFPHRPTREGMTSDRFVREFGRPRRADEELNDRHQDLAFAVQAVLEEAMIHFARIVHRRTQEENLCLTGGVALNCLANGRVVREGPFKNVFVPFAAGDAGCAVGAAFMAEAELGGPLPPSAPGHPFVGPEYTNSEIEDALKRAGVPYTRPKSVVKTTAEEIARGRIVGRFAGPMEFGPRALGHRSILADPRRAENADRINRAIKWREPFRPFAPSVPEERAGEHFEGTPSPYMAVVLKVKAKSRELLPAVTHRDGTARVQAVRREWDPEFHALHLDFEKASGVPVLLNTSFNVKGEPIVCTPDDALATYLKTGLDAMAIGPFWLKKAAR
ncbi:MAG: carbamoyltransferase [Deltaproteobacteria bacterium]|nr:carbamoyltransferase [Deltaproteobacteria bacterium]